MRKLHTFRRSGPKFHVHPKNMRLFCNLLGEIKAGDSLVFGHVVHFAAEAHLVRALEALGPEHLHEHVHVFVQHAGEVAQGVPADRLGLHQGRLQLVPVLFLRIANRVLFALGLRENSGGHFHGSFENQIVKISHQSVSDCDDCPVHPIAVRTQNEHPHARNVLGPLHLFLDPVVNLIFKI
jgi:hypothetical protein